MPRSLVDELVDRRLLTVDRDRVSREPTVEIAHESLLRSWPRLRDWLDEDQDWLRELRQLSSAARLWTTTGRDDADLYQRARLAVAEECSAGRWDAFTPDEAEFLRASARLRDAEAAAVEERARAAERQNRRLRHRLVGLAVVAVVAVVAAGVALVQSRRADLQADRADQQAALADARSKEASDQRATAEGAAAAAAASQADSERAAASARSAQLDATFANLVNQSVLARPTRPDLAALLAAEAYRRRPDEARSALFSTFTRDKGFTGYHIVDNTTAVIAMVSFGTEGHLAALVVPSQLVELDSDGTELRSFGSLPGGTPKRELGNLVRVSADGSTVVAAMSTTRAMVWQAWSLSSGQALGPAHSVPFDQPGGPLDVSLYYRFDDANLNHDGTLLAIGGGPRGHVLVMRTTDGTIVGDLSVDPPAGGWEWPRSENTASVLFAQDDRLLVGGPTGAVLVTEPLSADASERPGRRRAANQRSPAERRAADGRRRHRRRTGAVDRRQLATGAVGPGIRRHGLVDASALGRPDLPRGPADRRAQPVQRHRRGGAPRRGLLRQLHRFDRRRRPRHRHAAAGHLRPPARPHGIDRRHGRRPPARRRQHHR